MRIIKPLIALLLAMLLFAAPLCALAQETDDSAVTTEQEEGDEGEGEVTKEPDPPIGGVELVLDQNATEIKYIGRCRVALKMRKSPDLNANGVGGLAIDSDVPILSMDDTWAKVAKGEILGYVQSKYLEDICYYDPKTGTKGEAVNFVNASQGAVYAENGFVRNFVGYTVVKASMYQQPGEDSALETRIEMYEQLYVNEFRADGWAYCEYRDHFGYVPTDKLFKFDRIDPYAGAIPGCIVYPLMATVKKTTDIKSYENDKVLKTIYPGATICVEEPDEQGRYKTPYWRTTGYISQEDVYQLQRVVPYADAQPGDLVSVMTTYYALGISSAEYQGRNWNIYLSTSIINGTLLKVGEQFNMNDVIGPYSKGKGYKTAPIASKNASVGYGGGTCQVNTTLYNVLIQVPIYVNYRQVHANAGAKYFLKGFDAAVGSRDSINMVFTNTLPYDIRINFHMSDGALTVCLYRA